MFKALIFCLSVTSALAVGIAIGSFVIAPAIGKKQAQVAERLEVVFKEIKGLGDGQKPGWGSVNNAVPAEEKPLPPPGNVKPRGEKASEKVESERGGATTTEVHSFQHASKNLEEVSGILEGGGGHLKASEKESPIGKGTKTGFEQAEKNLAEVQAILGRAFK